MRAVNKNAGVLCSFVQRRGFAASRNPVWVEFDSGAWNAYKKVAPHAQKIQDLFKTRGETVINDHIAFRTVSVGRMNLEAIADNLRKHLGYNLCATYEFKKKHLCAAHFAHVSSHPTYPLIFVSELQCERISDKNRIALQRMSATVAEDYCVAEDSVFQWCRRRMWEPLTVRQLDELSFESEYGAWVAAFGVVANHYTVSVNALKHSASIEDVNELLQENGCELNRAGGNAVKGSPELGLVQSSTKAPFVDVPLRDGSVQMRGGYYEFAQRFELTPEGGGEPQLFKGFIADSANDIFESTYK